MSFQYFKDLSIGLSLFAGICLLSACGSDDESSNNGADNTVVIPTSPIAITTSNSAKVAVQALDADSQADQGASQLSSLAPSDSTSIQPAATTNCVSGTMTTPDDVNGIGTYRFDSCNLVYVTLNGNVVVTGTGNINGDMFDGALSYNAFTITFFPNSVIETDVVFNGTINQSWSTSGNIITANKNGSLLRITNGDSGMELRNFNFDASLDNNSQLAQSDFNFTLNSTELGGSVSAETIQTLRKYTAASYPHSGTVVVTGANNSSVQISVNDGATGVGTDTVILDTDADGDGNYESSEIITWIELESRI